MCLFISFCLGKNSEYYKKKNIWSKYSLFIYLSFEIQYANKKCCENRGLTNKQFMMEMRHLMLVQGVDYQGKKKKLPLSLQNLDIHA